MSGCLDQCEHGPTVVVYPDAVWYGRVTAADVDEIIESHIVNGKPVERLMIARRLPQRLQLPAPRSQAPGIKHLNADTSLRWRFRLPRAAISLCEYFPMNA